MECSCIRQTAIPGTTRLFSDYLYDFDRVKRFFPAHFLDPDALADTVKKLDFPQQRRTALVAALREQNGDSAALSRLASPTTVAVVTGQQVGLFSGPAYTIYKALTAVRLARELNEQNIPAVPVFWLATEDHDLAEVDHAWVFDEAATPTKITVPEAVAGGPVGSVLIPSVPVQELRKALGKLPFADEVVARVEAAYAGSSGSDPTFGSGFVSLLRELLKDCGLLYLDPLASSVREIAAPLLQQAVHRIPDLIAALRQRDRELVAAGYHAQVHIDDTTSLVFLIEGNKRIPLRWKDGRFFTRDGAYTPDQLDPLGGSVSPNALLRPVMEDYLLPTVAYVAGPSEAAYMAQAQVLYEQLLGRMPVIFPRNSFTLLDPRAKKLSARYELRVPDLFDHQENVESRIAARLVPAGLKEELAETRSAVSSLMGTMGSKLLDFDPTLREATSKSTAKILYQVEKLSRKAAREKMRRDEHARQDAAYLMNLIYPYRHLQERFYSIIPLLAQHGLDLPQRLISQSHLACPDHLACSL